MSNSCVLRVSLLLMFLSAAVVRAQPVRTWVASDGLDTNPCTRTQPCRNFGAAIAAVASRGEVVAIDSAGYGAVTVNKAVSLVSPAGVHAAIAPTTGTAITVSAMTGDQVVLRNLYLQSQGATHGISFTSGGSLYVEEVIINGFSSRGVQVDLSADGKFFVTRSVVRGLPGVGSFGIHVQATGGSAQGVIDGSKFEGHQIGIVASTNARLSVRDTVSAGNFQTGIGTNSGARLSIDHCLVTQNNFGIVSGENTITHISNTVVSENASVGIQATDGGKIRVSDSKIVLNGTGVATTMFGANELLSRQNNTLKDNTTDGTFTGTFSAQ